MPSQQWCCAAAQRSSSLQRQTRQAGGRQRPAAGGCPPRQCPCPPARRAAWTRARSQPQCRLQQGGRGGEGRQSAAGRLRCMPRRGAPRCLSDRPSHKRRSALGTRPAPLHAAPRSPACFMMPRPPAPPPRTRRQDLLDVSLAGGGVAAQAGQEVSSDNLHCVGGERSRLQAV